MKRMNRQPGRDAHLSQLSLSVLACCGILNVVMRRITVRCKPVDIPVEFTVDVTDLDIGDVIHVGRELVIPTS